MFVWHSAEPAQVPLPLHWSLVVQALPSSHEVPLDAFEIVQLDVPLHVLV